jgi:hypothetical protein
MKPNGIVDRITRILPYDLRAVLGYPYKRYIFFRHLRGAFGDRYEPQRSPGPMPPPELLANEALMHQDDLKHWAKPNRISAQVFAMHG